MRIIFRAARVFPITSGPGLGSHGVPKAVPRDARVGLLGRGLWAPPRLLPRATPLGLRNCSFVLGEGQT